MKNSILFSITLLALGAFTSCQKEDLADAANTQTITTGATDRGGVTNANGGTLTNTGGGTTINPGGTVEKWILCDAQNVATKVVDQTGARFLTLADAAGNPYMKFTGINLSAVPANVVTAIKPYFNGLDMGSAWTLTQNSTTYYLVESIKVPGVVVLATKNGGIRCTGTK